MIILSAVITQVTISQHLSLVGVCTHCGGNVVTTEPLSVYPLGMLTAAYMAAPVGVVVVVGQWMLQ